MRPQQRAPPLPMDHVAPSPRQGCLLSRGRAQGRRRGSAPGFLEFPRAPSSASVMMPVAVFGSLSPEPNATQTVPHRSLPPACRGWLHHHSLFTSEGTRAQRGSVAFPRLHSKKSLAWNPASADPQRSAPGPVLSWPPQERAWGKRRRPWPPSLTRCLNLLEFLFSFLLRSMK